MCCCGCELALAIAKIQANGSTDAPAADIPPTMAAHDPQPGFASWLKRVIVSKRRWIFSPVLKSFEPTSPAIGSTNG